MRHFLKVLLLGTILISGTLFSQDAFCKSPRMKELEAAKESGEKIVASAGTSSSTQMTGKERVKNETDFGLLALILQFQSPEL